MKALNKTAIQKAQDDYFNLLLEYKSLIRDSNLTLPQIASFLDEIMVFWLKRLDIIEYEIVGLTNQSDCFLLSGAVYLNIKDNEHFFFKTLGDYHMLSDPFLKQEGFIRFGNKVNTKEIIRYFCNAYEDTVKLLQDYRNEFYILPIREIVWKSKDEHQNLLNAFFWKFISSIFPEQISSNEEFISKYKSFVEIEGDLNEFVNKNLIFTDETDSQLSLEDRVKRFCNDQANFSVLSQHMTEPEKFLLITYCQISQVIDILLTCTSMGLIPYIRSSITFRYLAFIMNTFIDNSQLRNMLEKTIVFFILYKTIDRDIFQEIDFQNYCIKVKEANLLDRILKKMRERTLNIFFGGIKELSKIIQDEFSTLKIIAEN